MGWGGSWLLAPGDRTLLTCPQGLPAPPTFTVSLHSGRPLPPLGAQLPPVSQWVPSPPRLKLNFLEHQTHRPHGALLGLRGPWRKASPRPCSSHPGRLAGPCPHPSRTASHADRGAFLAQLAAPAASLNISLNRGNQSQDCRIFKITFTHTDQPPQNIARGKRICLPVQEMQVSLGRFPWSRKWQPTQVLLPGKSHGQRSLVGRGPWGHKESDTTEHTRMQGSEENSLC